MWVMPVVAVAFAGGWLTSVPTHNQAMWDTVGTCLGVAVADPAGWRLISLHLDGSPGDVLPLRSEAAGLRVVLDNAAPSHGPTTFFLLERRP